ncbi:MAG: class II fructose-bisphosphate aldolase, partial [Alphaproteobacteria bacterium]
MRPRLHISARPWILAAIMSGCVIAVLLASLVPVGLAGEALIARRQRLVATTARDYFVAFARERGVANMAEALDRRTRLEVGAFSYSAFSLDGRLIGGENLLAYQNLPGPGFHTLKIHGQDYETLVQPLDDGGKITIFEDLSERREFGAAVVNSIFLALLIGLIVVAATGIWLQRLLVRRAEGVARAAERIVDGDLSARAPIENSGDVFDHLAGSVNAMLARIETLMGDVRLATDSLAHDLRLPLAHMRTAMSRAADPEVDEGSRLQAAEDALIISDEILATLTTLLDIARAEAGLSRDSMTEVDLPGLIEQVVELFGPTMEDAGQALVFDAPPEPIRITVHALLLRQAIGNLLHNAARFAGPGGTVRVRVERREAGVRTSEMALTDPEAAARFVQETRVDSLAVSIGTAHG